MVTLGARGAGTVWLRGLLFLLLFLTAAGDPLTIYTESFSSAVLGSAVLLKCRFNIGGAINLTTLQVQWYFSEQLLAQYNQGKGTFTPRMSISEQELRIGNASLGMEKVKLSDQGLYSCVVRYGMEQQQSKTTLHVFAAPRLTIPWQSAVTDTMSSFLCRIWGFYPEDITVEWLRDGRVLTDAIRSVPQKNLDGTFNVTAIYMFTPTDSDSGSVFSCHVSHSALAQPLQEGFALDVAGACTTPVLMIITVVCVALLLVTVAALAFYCWRRRKTPKGHYNAMEEMPPEDPARSRDNMHGEERAMMGNEGDSEVAEAHEVQSLLTTEVPEESRTQEQEDRAQVTGSAGSKVCEFQDGGEAVTAGPGIGAPEPHRDSSANTEAEPIRPRMAGDGTGDKASAGLAGEKEGDAASNFTAVVTVESAAETVPTTTTQEEDEPEESGGNSKCMWNNVEEKRLM
uniref:Ig-like domain-containing protein n=1 Tax=Pelusios castaneus TaxID=367368 RepID=A0A8C8S978_9SAUR